jgi:hypothetical protein
MSAASPGPRGSTSDARIADVTEQTVAPPAARSRFRRARGAARQGGPHAPFAATLALIVTFALAAFAIVMPLVMILHRPKPLPPPLPSLGLATQNQTGETLVYLLAYAVILPFALVVGGRVAEAVHAASGRRALTTVSGLLAAGLALAVLTVKLCGALGLSQGVRAVLVIAVLWWAIAAAVLAFATRPGRWPSALADRAGAPLWALTAVLALGTLLCVTDLRSISPVGLGLGAICCAAALFALDGGRLPPVPRGLGGAADALILIVLLLAVPDLLIFRPEDRSGHLGIAIETGIIQFHQNFLLGPAQEVLHGGAMLVDTASQYGVGTIYLLTGWFQLVPIGYGTFGLLDGLLTALWFCAGFAIVRMAGTPRLLAAGAMAVGVVALIFNLSYPVGSLPQDGPLRFGLPMAVLLALVFGERWPRHVRAAGILALAIVGISSIWSLEGLVYTGAVFAIVSCLQAWLRPAPGRLAWLRRRGLEALLACVIAHLVFAAVTLAATGHLPDWLQYLAYLHAFLFGSLGDLTYDVAHWTPGLAVGAAYAASAAAIVELCRRRDAFVERERPALVAATGLTGYGIVLLSYYVDRSQDHILMHVSLPALLAGTVWLGVLARSHGTISRPVRLGGLAFGLIVGMLVLSVAWSSIGDRFPRSALAHAAPGGQSLRDALHRLEHPPALSTAAPEGVRLLKRYMPGEERSLVAVSPDLGTEILLRSDRVDELFLGDPWEASFVADQRVGGVRKAVDALRPGKRMLLDAEAVKVLAILRARPALDPLDATARVALPSHLAPLQQWALKRIQQRFMLRTIYDDGGSYSVVELEARPGR